MRISQNLTDAEIVCRLLEHEAATIQTCSQRIQPHHESARAMGLELRCEIYRHSAGEYGSPIDYPLPEKGRLPATYGSGILVGLYRADQRFGEAESGQTHGRFCMLFPCVSYQSHTLQLDEPSADTLQTHIEVLLRRAFAYLAETDTQPSPVFEMPVDDLFSTADGFGNLPVGVLVTGIAEWGHVRPGDTVRFLDSGGGERALAVVHSVYAQDDILAGRPKALRVSPVGEVALLFTGQDLLETLVPGEHTAVI